MKFRPVFVYEETHQAIKILAAQANMSMARLLQVWADRAIRESSGASNGAPAPTTGNGSHSDAESPPLQPRSV